MSLRSVQEQKAITGKKEDVQSTISNYRELFDEKGGKGSVEVRSDQYMSLTNTFYNMVTDIYEYGWGQSFHFAPRHKWESFATSIARQEMYLALKLGLTKGQRALDLGCGVGGPGRVIARFSEANIVGVNNNEYQLQRCKKITGEQGLSHLCSYIQADFHHLPVEANSVDAAFHLEALLHSPNRVDLFKEIFRVIKPGGYFAGYDWVVTDKFKATNPEHVRIKKAIELGNGIADMISAPEILDAMRQAGFEILEYRDLAPCNPAFEIPWYDSLDGTRYNLAHFGHTPLGMYLTNKMIWALESVKLAPKGTHDIHNMLTKVAVDLVAGGKTETFSPIYFYLARKPE